MLVNHILTDVMFSEYYSTSYLQMKNNYKESTLEADRSNSNFYAVVATSFTSFLKSNQESSDQFLRLCCNFLLMSRDLFDFIDAYRNSDSIFLELYYERFASVWRVLGQHRYLESVWKQMEQLYLDVDYNQLQIIRMSRTIRQYDWATGKHAIAQDEMMELINRWYSLFPMPRTMKGFVRESVQVGLSLSCIIFMNEACNLTDSKVLPPRAASQRFDGKTTAFMVELLCLLEAGRYHPNRQFSGTFIAKPVKANKVKTKLTLKRVEDNMRGEENEPVHDICHTLRQALAPGKSLAEMALCNDIAGVETDKNSKVYPAVSNLFDEESAAVAMNAVDDDAQQVVGTLDDSVDYEPDGMEESKEDIVTLARQMSKDIAKNGFNMLSQENIWKRGAAQLFKDNIKKKRVGGRKRLERKLQLARAIARAEKTIADSLQNQQFHEDEGHNESYLWKTMRQRTTKFR